MSALQRPEIEHLADLAKKDVQPSTELAVDSAWFFVDLCNSHNIAKPEGTDDMLHRLLHDKSDRNAQLWIVEMTKRVEQIIDQKAFKAFVDQIEARVLSAKGAYEILGLPQKSPEALCQRAWDAAITGLSYSRILELNLDKDTELVERVRKLSTIIDRAWDNIQHYTPRTLNSLEANVNWPQGAKDLVIKMQRAKTLEELLDVQKQILDNKNNLDKAVREQLNIAIRGEVMHYFSTKIDTVRDHAELTKIMITIDVMYGRFASLTVENARTLRQMANRKREDLLSEGLNEITSIGELIRTAQKRYIDYLGDPTYSSVVTISVEGNNANRLQQLLDIQMASARSIPEVEELFHNIFQVRRLKILFPIDLEEVQEQAQILLANAIDNRVREYQDNPLVLEDLKSELAYYITRGMLSEHRHNSIKTALTNRIAQLRQSAYRGQAPTA